MIADPNRSDEPAPDSRRKFRWTPGAAPGGANGDSLFSDDWFSHVSSGWAIELGNESYHPAGLDEGG